MSGHVDQQKNVQFALSSASIAKAHATVTAIQESETAHLIEVEKIPIKDYARCLSACC